MAETSIEWTATPRADGTLAPGYSFNAWVGCEKVSPGCKFCYAEHDTPARVARKHGVELWGGVGTRRQVKAESGWWSPLRWDREALRLGERRRVFAASQSDVFEQRADLIAPRDRLFGLIAATPRLDWLVLTKRVAEAVRFFEDPLSMHRQDATAQRLAFVYGPDHGMDPGDYGLRDWPPRNVWMGTSVENQEWAVLRVPELLKVKAAVRFLSVEPILGPVDLSPWLGPTKVNWVIVGGESGPDARPCHLSWVGAVVDRCEEAGVPCFVKQLGACPMLDVGSAFLQGRQIYADPKGGDPSEWPERLRVRRWPEAAIAGRKVAP